MIEICQGPGCGAELDPALDGASMCQPCRWRCAAEQRSLAAAAEAEAAEARTLPITGREALRRLYSRGHPLDGGVADAILQHRAYEWARDELGEQGRLTGCRPVEAPAEVGDALVSRRSWGRGRVR